MATAGTLEYLISINSSQVNSGLGNAESKVKSFGDKMSKWAVAKGQIIGRLAEKAGAATLQFVKGSVQESMGFDKTMSQVAATLGKTTGEVQDLAKFARQMGAETAFTAQEAAEGLNYMALAGYDATKSMKMLPLVLNLAAAGNMDLAAAADMVTDAESALSLTTGETEALIDQMAKTASLTNTSVEQLGEAILTVGGTAKILAGDTKELNMVLGVLADNGIKGSEGGTALRNMILSLSAPTDKAAKRFKQLNIDIFDTEGNMRALPDIMQDLNTAMAGMSQKERTAILSDIFNKRDLKAAEALLGTNAERWEELGYKIEHSAGAAKQMADTQLDNLQGDVTKLKSALGEAKLTLVEKLTPSLRVFAKSGTKLIQRLTDAFKERGLKGAMQEASKIFKEFGKNLKIRAKAKISDWLDLGDDASWGDIVRKIIPKITEGFKKHLGKGGNFLKQLILGNDYKEGESTWKDVGDKISGWMTEAFAEGGILRQLLVGGADKLATIIQLAGEFISGIATWIADNPDTFTSILDSLVTAITTAAPKIADALVTVLNNPNFQAAIMNMMGIFAEMIGKLFTEGPDALKGVMLGYGAKKGFDLYKWAQGIGLFGGGSAAATGSGSAAIASIGKFFLGGAGTPALVAFAGILPALMAQNELDRKKITKRKGLFSEADKGGEFSDLIRQGADATFNFDENGNYDRNFLGQLNLNPNDKPYDFLMGLNSLSAQEKAKLMTRIHQKANGTEGYFTTDLLTKFWSDPNNPLFTSSMLNAMTQNITDALAGNEVNVPLPVELKLQDGAKEKLEGEVGTLSVPVEFVPSNLYGMSLIRPFSYMFGNAKGNWDVPYDNYPALLHRGEMVLNKSQARQFRDGEGGGSYDMSSLVNNAISSAMSKVYVMLNGDKVGDLTSRRIGRNINATTFNKLRALGG